MDQLKDLKDWNKVYKSFMRELRDNNIKIIKNNGLFNIKNIEIFNHELDLDVNEEQIGIEIAEHLLDLIYPCQKIKFFTPPEPEPFQYLYIKDRLQVIEWIEIGDPTPIHYIRACYEAY